MKRSSVFVKVFLYTTLFSVLLACVAAGLFSAQIVSYYRMQSMISISNIYQRMIDRPAGQGDIAESAARFHEQNQSLEFVIKDASGQTVYATPDIDISAGEGELLSEELLNRELPNREFPNDEFPNMVVLSDEYTLFAKNDGFFDQSGLTLRVLVALLATLAICVIGALVFARQMTRPIKKLANDSKRMASLEEVPPPAERSDELGALAHDVHSMYSKLKETIARLEDEIAREREMEEAQRYFFSAASHELKTPIAATSVLLEGMLENMGDYRDHPKYLRECVRLMDAQGKAVSEMLEIVKLYDGKIVPTYESLDLGTAVDALLPEFLALAEADGLPIVVDIPKGQICRTDPKMFARALANIMLNAVQNTPDGGEIRVWSQTAGEKLEQDAGEKRERAADASRQAAGENFRLCVLNTKARIEDAVLPRLFDPFYRADKARSQKSRRSGLGLTIVQKTLGAMGVAFALENSPDGVLFWMDLPTAQ
jgi:two-component system sensor histidine kinase VanS